MTYMYIYKSFKFLVTCIVCACVCVCMRACVREFCYSQHTLNHGYHCGRPTLVVFGGTWVMKG